MHDLFDSANLTDTKVEKFWKWMKVELRSIMESDSQSSIGFHTEVELLLINRFTGTK